MLYLCLTLIIITKLNGNAIKAFAADKITLNVTGLVTGSDIGHDC